MNVTNNRRVRLFATLLVVVPAMVSTGVPSVAGLALAAKIEDTPALEPTVSSTDRWTTYSKTTYAGNGTATTRIYPTPTFRQEGSGRWTSIDMTPRPATGSYGAVIAGAPVPVRFGRSSASLLELGFERGSVVVSSGDLDIRRAPVVVGTDVLYEKVAEATDLRYRVSPIGVTKELVLRSPAAPHSFRFHISDPSGRLGQARPVGGGGAYQFEQPVQLGLALGLEPAYAYEAASGGSVGPVHEPGSASQIVEPAGDGWDITVAVDPDWVKSRTYPIVLDPTFTFSRAGGSMLAGYVPYIPSGCGGCADLNTTSSDLAAGTYTGGSVDHEPGRSAFRFDLSAIPQFAEVTSASFGAYLAGCLGNPEELPADYKCDEHDYVVELRELLGTWSGDSTYDQLAAITSPSTLTSQSLPRFTISSSCGGCRWMHFNLLDKVRSWVATPASNHGFIARLQAEAYNIGGPGWAYLGPRGNQGYPQPYLEVTYTTSSGAAPIGESLGETNPSQIRSDCHATEFPVNCRTGNFWHTFTDLAIAGRGAPLRLDRTYNSLAASTAGAFGYGWSSSYSMHVGVDASGAVTVHQENGSQVSFTSNGSGGYDAPARTLATLSKQPDGSYVFTRRQRERFEFDTAGRLRQMSDLNGYTTTLEHDAAGLRTVTDDSGRKLTFSWDNGRVSAITDSADRTVSYGYDAAGNLTNVIDVAGQSSTFTYDSEHRLLSMRDPRGGTVSNTYDTLARVVTQTDQVNGLTRFDYTADQTVVTDPRGTRTIYRFRDGLLDEVTQAADTVGEATWSYGHTSPTLGTTSITDPLGRIRTTIYDQDGNVTEAVDPGGVKIAYSYSPLGDLLEMRPAEGSPTTYRYDSNGNLLEMVRTHTETGEQQRTSHSYDDPAHPGDVTSTTDPTGRVWRYEYNIHGYRTVVEDPAGKRTVATYDTLGRTTSETTAAGNEPGADPADYRTVYLHNSHGQVIEVRHPAGSITRRSYDATGNLLSLEADSRTTSFGYDLAGRGTSIRYPDGTETAAEYDSTGNVIARTDGNGHITRYTYDPRNLMRTTTDPRGRTTTSEYDTVGRRTSVTDHDGNVTLFYHDANDRVTRVGADIASSVDFTYTPTGAVKTMDTSTISREYRYDSLDRLVATIDTFVSGTFPTTAGGGVTYSYDLAGRVTRLDVRSRDITAGFVARTINRTYDQVGRLASTGDSENLAYSEFIYDADGRVTVQDNGNGTSATYLRDANRLGGIEHRAGPAPFMSLAYEHDAAGRTTADTELAAPVSASTRLIAHDLRDRLRTTTSVSEPLSTTYDYDGANNITAVSRPGHAEELTYDSADQLGQRMLRLGDQVITTDYTYDGRGNRVKQTDSLGNVTRFGFDRQGRMTSYSGAVTTSPERLLPSLRVASANYQYDADGLRTDLQWDRVNHAFPVVVSDNHQNVYLTGPSGLPVAQIGRNDSTLYFHQDQLGSTRALTGAGGATVVTYNYDEWGNTTTSGTGVVNPFQFAGQFTDVQTGLIYMRARWYDPATRQFISRDPLVEATGETYVYAKNNPIDYADPTGLYAQAPCGGDGDYYLAGSARSGPCGPGYRGRERWRRVGSGAGAWDLTITRSNGWEQRKMRVHVISNGGGPTLYKGRFDGGRTKVIGPLAWTTFEVPGRFVIPWNGTQARWTDSFKMWVYDGWDATRLGDAGTGLFSYAIDLLMVWCTPLPPWKGPGFWR